MEEVKAHNRHEIDGRDSESLAEDERAGLLSNKTGTFRQKKNFSVMGRLIPLALLISIGLNIIQLVYVNVHHPPFYSLYGM